MNVKKQAMKDAAEYARAQMFFGEGAGTRRKIIESTVAWNVDRLPGYREAFNKAMDKQNWAEHATMAVRERKRIDRGKFINRNIKGLVSGNRRQLSTGVAVGLTAWYIAHETGLDEPIKAEVKRQYKSVKTFVHDVKTTYKAKREGKQTRWEKNDDGTYRLTF